MSGERDRLTQAGTKRFGPSGVGIWSAPTIDVRRNLLYVATGNNYTEPDVPATDAVLVMDLRTGAKRWARSLLPSDRWNALCVTPDKAHCPPVKVPYFDFGSAPILNQLEDGGELILAGQTSGGLYALDPEKRGEIRQIRLGRGGTLDGIEVGDGGWRRKSLRCLLCPYDDGLTP